MKVLHVITGLATGGAERQLLSLLRHSPGEREVAVLTNPGTVAGAIRALGTPVHHIGMRGNRDLSALGRLTRLMRARRYDLVHTHLYRACVYGRVAAQVAGVPAVVATEHSLGEHRIEGRRKTRGVRALYLMSERLGDVTIAVSPTVAERLVGWGVSRRRITVIPNGVDVAAFRFDAAAGRLARRSLGVPDGAFVVGGIGRLDRGKRFDVLIRALKRLDGVILLLVGEGPARAGLEELARREGVAGRVVFAGESPRVPALLSAVDVLAAPSAEESFGLAVVEGLAAGLRVLYTVCPAIDDLPPGAVPGALRVPAEPGWFAQALRPLVREGAVRLPAPEAVARYDIGRHATRISDLYRRLLERDDAR